MTDSKKLFSIVIPAYNYAKTLERALESALNQEGADYEVLVINDGSTDDTEAILRKLHDCHPGKFRSVTRANSGLAATRNYGINHTNGQWLIFLDSDDEFEPEALAYLRNAIEKNHDARIVVGGHISVEPDGRERCRGVNSQACEKMSQEELFEGYLLKKTITPSNGATAMHRDVFARVMYPEQFRNSEDIPVFAYVFANYPCAFIDKAINRIYKHADSLRHNLTFADEVGTKLVDVVFNTANIPEHCQKFKKIFGAQRCLSLFRTFYLAGNKEKALHYYRLAIALHWQALFNFSYTKKALRCLVGK